jgi:WD40 repeat protein
LQGCICKRGNTPLHVAIISLLESSKWRGNNLAGPYRGYLFCLSFYSDDGKYLASGGNDRLIKIWPTKSSRTPTQQSRKTLRNHQHKVLCFAFASDSNILASGCSGERKLWNVEDEVCLHTIYHQHGSPSSLVFLGVGEIIKCLAATTDGSLIRVSWNSKKHAEFTSDIVVDGATRYLNSVFSYCGSLLATVDLTNKLRVYNIKTEGMSTVQSVALPAYCILKTNAGLAFSSDNKTLMVVICDTTGNQDDDSVVRLLDVEDLTLQRKLKWQSRGLFPVSLAIGPSSRCLATARSDGRVRLWSV